jgi:glycosyltransferase involved in cell wall biosynthesis
MEEKQYKVSVLMLTFNQEKYVNEAIKGVMNQETEFTFQLVIGDDCSTDQTLQICKKWQGRYPSRIVILENERNKGLQQNFIRTYNACNCVYMAICEGDDYWIDKHKLQRQVKFLDLHPDFSTCIHRVVNYYEEDRSMSLSNGGQKRVTNIIDLAQSNYISNVSAVFRKGLFGPLPEWFSEVSTYDYAVHLLNAQFGKIYYMPRCMAVYRKHNSAIWSRSGVDKQYMIAIKIRKLLMDYFKGTQPLVYDQLLNAYNNNSIALLRYYLSQKDQEKVELVREKLLQHNPNWTREELLEKERIPVETDPLKRRVMGILKEGRVVISRMIPVPRVK